MRSMLGIPIGASHLLEDLRLFSRQELEGGLTSTQVERQQGGYIEAEEDSQSTISISCRRL